MLPRDDHAYVYGYTRKNIRTNGALPPQEMEEIPKVTMNLALLLTSRAQTGVERRHLSDVCASSSRLGCPCLANCPGHSCVRLCCLFCTSAQ